MRRLIVLSFTGRKAENLIIMRRVARKIRRAAEMGQCVLVDCEDVQLGLPMLELLAAEAHDKKVKFCGLSLADQTVLSQLINRRSETTLE